MLARTDAERIEAARQLVEVNKEIAARRGAGSDTVPSMELPSTANPGTPPGRGKIEGPKVESPEAPNSVVKDTPTLAQVAWGTKDNPRVVAFSPSDMSIELPRGDGWGFVNVSIDGKPERFGLIVNGSDGLEFAVDKTGMISTDEYITLDGGGFTQSAMSKTISAYKDMYGVAPPSLPGDLSMDNLYNFQREFSNARAENPAGTIDDWSQAAIGNISFGRARASLGYGNFNIQLGQLINRQKNGATLTNVPKSVHIIATPSN